MPVDGGPWLQWGSLLALSISYLLGRTACPELSCFNTRADDCHDVRSCSPLRGKTKSAPHNGFYFAMIMKTRRDPRGIVYFEHLDFQGVSKNYSGPWVLLVAHVLWQMKLRGSVLRRDVLSDRSAVTHLERACSRGVWRWITQQHKWRIGHNARPLGVTRALVAHKARPTALRWKRARLITILAPLRTWHAEETK